MTSSVRKPVPVGAEGTLVVGEGLRALLAGFRSDDVGEQDGVVAGGDVFVDLGGDPCRRAGQAGQVRAGRPGDVVELVPARAGEGGGESGLVGAEDVQAEASGAVDDRQELGAVVQGNQHHWGRQGQ